MKSLGADGQLAMVVAACLPLVTACSGHGVSSRADGVPIRTDVYGDRNEESISVIDEEVLFLDTTGRVRTSVTLPGNATPAVVHDLHGDGKEDLFFGSRNLSAPRITVLNECGRIVGEFLFEDQELRGRELLPCAIAGNTLYAVSKESWQDRPHGVLALSLPRLETRWFCHLPVSPTGVTVVCDPSGRELILVDNMNPSTSVRYLLGTDARFVDNSDADLHLIVLDTDDDVITYRSFADTCGKHYSGSISFGTIDSTGRIPVTVIDDTTHHFTIPIEELY